jgi:hypothetical protein
MSAELLEGRLLCGHIELLSGGTRWVSNFSYILQMCHEPLLIFLRLDKHAHYAPILCVIADKNRDLEVLFDNFILIYLAINC